MGKETTKKVIAYAFKELLKEKPYNKITHDFYPRF